MVISVSYYASGQPYVQTTTTGSASVTGTWGLNKRLRVTSYSNLSSANPGYTNYGYALSYTSNGNVATSSETVYQPGVGPKSWSRTNSYDPLNRLSNSTSAGAILYGCAETTIRLETGRNRLLTGEPIVRRCLLRFRPITV